MHNHRHHHTHHHHTYRRHQANKQIYVPDTEELEALNPDQVEGGLSALGCERVYHGQVTPAATCGFRHFAEEDARYQEAKVSEDLPSVRLLRRRLCAADYCVEPVAQEMIARE